MAKKGVTSPFSVPKAFIVWCAVRFLEKAYIQIVRLYKMQGALAFSNVMTPIDIIGS